MNIEKYTVVISEFGFLLEVDAPTERKGIISSTLTQSERDEDYLRSLKKNISEVLKVKENYFILLLGSGKKPNERNMKSLHKKDKNIFLFFSQTKFIPGYDMFTYDSFVDLPVSENQVDEKKRKEEPLKFYKSMYLRQKDSLNALVMNKKRYNKFCNDFIKFITNFPSIIEEYKKFFNQTLKKQLEEYVEEFDQNIRESVITREKAVLFLRDSKNEIRRLEDMEKKFYTMEEKTKKLKSHYKRVKILFPVRGALLTESLGEDDPKKYPMIYELNRLILKKNIRLIEEYQILTNQCYRFKEGYDSVVETRFEKYEFLSFLLRKSSEFLSTYYSKKEEVQIEEETEGEGEEEEDTNKKKKKKTPKKDEDFSEVGGRVYDHLKYSLLVEQYERRRGYIEQIRSIVTEEESLREKLRKHLYKLFKARAPFMKDFFPDLFACQSWDWDSRSLGTFPDDLLSRLSRSRDNGVPPPITSFSKRLNKIFFDDEHTQRNKIMMETILQPVIPSITNMKNDENEHDDDEDENNSELRGSFLTLTSSTSSSTSSPPPSSDFPESQDKLVQLFRLKEEIEMKNTQINESEEKIGKMLQDIDQLKEDLQKFKEENQEKLDAKESLYMSVIREKNELLGKLEILKSDLEREKKKKAKKVTPQIFPQDQFISVEDHKKEIESISKLWEEKKNEEEMMGWAGIVTPLVKQLNDAKRERDESVKNERVARSRIDRLEQRGRQLVENESKFVLEMEKLRRQVGEWRMQTRVLSQKNEVLERSNTDRIRTNQQLIQQMTRITEKHEESKRITEDDFCEVKKSLVYQNQVLLGKIRKLKEGDNETVVLQHQQISRLAREVEKLTEEVKEISVSRDHHYSKFIELRESMGNNNNNNNSSSSSRVNPGFRNVMNNNHDRLSASNPQISFHHESSRPPPIRRSSLPPQQQQQSPQSPMTIQQLQMRNNILANENRGLKDRMSALERNLNNRIQELERENRSLEDNIKQLSRR